MDGFWDYFRIFYTFSLVYMDYYYKRWRLLSMFFEKIIPISIFSIYTPFVREWSGNRICIPTIEYFHITDRRFACGFSIHNEDGPIALSLASKNWNFAAIATHPDYRNFGRAKRVLNETLRAFRLNGLTYRTFVARDNPASIRLLESCGLKRIKTEKKQRSSGEYTAILYSS
jgi:ribosomal protein S18 acetylase RimI-like enzyme